MSLFSFSSLIGFIPLFAISIFLFIKLKKKNLSENFGWTCLISSLWSFATFKFSTTQLKEVALLWMKIAHASTILTPVFFFHFVSGYTKKYNRKTIIVVYFLAFIFLFFNFFYKKFFDYVWVFNRFYFFRSTIIHNPLHIIFYLFFYWGLLIYTFLLLIRSLKEAYGIKRNQIKYLILGMAIGWVGPHGMWLLVLGIPLYPYSNFLIGIYPLIIFYAIVKHQLLDINIVIKKGLVYSVLIALITSIYLIFILVVGKLFQDIFGYKSFLINLLAAFTIALLFTPLKNFVQSFVDRSFFKGTLSSLAEERERLEEELRRSDRLKAVSTLAAGMAHEIKNPLTSIKTFTEYLDKNKDNPEFIDKFKRIVGSEVDKINNIVHQLLDFAKPAPLKLINCNIHQLLEETLTLLSNDLLQHKIKLVKEYSTQSIQIKADSNQLKQAFLNIILNAIEAMPNSGTLTVSTNQLNNELTISIKDTGKGIPEKDLAHIFDPFFTTSDKGTGLGLSITHGIIKEHNGRIEVGSKVGVGSEFKIVLTIDTRL